MYRKLFSLPALMIAMLVLVGFVGAPTAHAAGLGQDAEVPMRLLDMIDAFLTLSSLALLVIPLTEVRKLLGGLPDIPLPSSTNEDGTIKKNSIRAGRWVSALVAAGVLAFGHIAGILSSPDWADPKSWAVVEWGMLAAIANIVYSKWWRGQLQLDPEVAAAARRGMI